MTTKTLPGQNCMNRARPVQTAHHKGLMLRVQGSRSRVWRELEMGLNLVKFREGFWDRPALGWRVEDGGWTVEVGGCGV